MCVQVTSHGGPHLDGPPGSVVAMPVSSVDELDEIVNDVVEVVDDVVEVANESLVVVGIPVEVTESDVATAMVVPLSTGVEGLAHAPTRSNRRDLLPSSIS